MMGRLPPTRRQSWLHTHHMTHVNEKLSKCTALNTKLSSIELKLEDPSSDPGQVITKTLKIVLLVAASIGSQHFKARARRQNWLT